MTSGTVFDCDGDTDGVLPEKSGKSNGKAAGQLDVTSWLDCSGSWGGGYWPSDLPGGETPSQK